MLQCPEATPCLILTTSASLKPFTFKPYEPTEELHFTADVQRVMQKAPPRRRNSTQPQAQSQNLVVQPAETISNGAAKAKHLGDQENFDRQSNNDNSMGSGAKMQAMLPARRCVSVLHSERQPDDSTTVPNQGKGINQQNDKDIRKKPRRRTIWVPPEDTTVLTIHPRLRSDARSLSKSSLKVVNQSDAWKRRQKQPLAAALRRAPLQPTLKPLQEREDQQDIAANGPGKENLLPLTAAMSRDKIHKGSQIRARRVSLFEGASRCAAYRSDALPFSDPSQAAREQSQSTAEVGFSNDQPKKATRPFRKLEIVKEQRKSTINKRNTLHYGTTWKASADPHINNSASQPPPTLIASMLRKVASSTEQKYPVMHEDVERPEILEDTWLNDQEAILAQCVNGLFETINNRDHMSHGHQRRTLLGLYQGAECSLLHGRLKASLLYGCLGRPKDSFNASSLKSDVGICRSFISLWARNYSLDMLSAAAEVVVGREALVDSRCPKSAHTQKNCKKSLEAFLDSYLLRNEDAPDAEQSSPAWCWRRTMLRSMMVIYLLDKAKQMNIISTNLYQASSTIKSSLAFLRELIALIHPSAGNICRLLKSLDYHVHHTQYPLSDFSYNIENLATDLRDGVRLTRLVELLLYPLGSRTTLEENVTIAMPKGEVLTTMLEEGQSLVLSQHLKYPCTARAQKIYNVHIALGALRAVHEVGQIAEDLSAEEIVDGHREKTLTLLWALLGNYGLDIL